MRSAKKISAFAVFKGRKEKFQVTDEKDKLSGMKKSSSEPVVNLSENQSQKEVKKFLKKLKGGSMRGPREGRKGRPTFLSELPIPESPVVAGKTVSESNLSPKRKTRTSPRGQQRELQALKPKSDNEIVPLPLSKHASIKKAQEKYRGISKHRKRRSGESTQDEAGQKKRRKLTEKPAEAEPVTPCMFDSTEEARKLFECIIHPVTTDKFFGELWERMPLLVRRHIPDYNKGWFSTAELDRILRKENIKYGVNLDITTYENGKRETHNPTGRAYAPVIWDYYQNGCSVRLLNPQTYSQNVWKFLASLQEYFGCCVGANIYLTPMGTQGFAPHYDDIEAFVLQLEGKKHWKLYAPRSEAEKLPRYSSENFTEKDIGTPILDVVLEAGDLLYFPRGVIHQAFAMDDAHSLHITVSCYQKNTWADLLEKLVPRALQVAMEEDVDFRAGLPRDYLQYMGIANSESSSSARTVFIKKVESLMSKLLTFAPVDSACDQMGKQVIFDSLPPLLTDEEKGCSIHGCGEKWDKIKMAIVGATEIEPDTHIKLIRKGVIRLVSEGEDLVHVYHCLENARIYHGHEEPQYIEVTVEAAPALEYLIHSYPKFATVDSLPLENVQEKVNVARALYEKGLLRTEVKLQPLDDDAESCCDENDL